VKVSEREMEKGNEVQRNVFFEKWGWKNPLLNYIIFGVLGTFAAL
jgi:hypothetical protein